MLTPLLLFLHITLMFAAVAVSAGTSFLSRLAYQTGQVGAIRGVGMAASRFGPLIPILFVLGGLFGLFTAISFGQNLLAPWLILAYIGWSIGMILGMTSGRVWRERLAALLKATPDGPLTPEIAAMYSDPRVRLESAVEYLVIVLIIFDMVVKPFS